MCLISRHSACHCIPSPVPLLGSVRLKAFRRLIRQLKPEVIHSYSSYTNFAAWWAALGTKAVAIGALRSDFTRKP